MPDSAFFTITVRLPRRLSPSWHTPSISAMTAGSRGLRASKISVTRGRPPVMSCVPVISRDVFASSVPATIFSPSETSIVAFSGIEYQASGFPSLSLIAICG